MRNLVLVSFCALFLTVIASAGIFRNAVKPSAKASAKVVKFSAKKAVRAAKPVPKVASYPVRHPVKSVKKSAHVAKKVVY